MKSITTMKRKIKDLPKFKRPREKLQEKGATALSDQELIAIILGSGQKGRDVMTISKNLRKVISKEGGNITLNSLSQVGGIGLAKGCQILAGFELARRYLIKEEYKINKPEDVLPLINEIKDKKQEHFICISLNGANEVIETRIVTVGLLNQTQIHPREVFADVITDRAASVILAHNHPSGELKPSDNDIIIHRKLKDAGKLLGIQVLDHIIISKKGHFSFQDQGIN